eukprot:TRINITY_DN1786_c0_g1_i2.p1 TRINITY_DN1786_c0_g1~~TRINITY_DN1786_c0_g1_i2.p1  ORF type:complete len:308 (-),score=43.03 TRINITY_DN1786_c0_g1_i2:919-1842(-)
MLWRSLRGLGAVLKWLYENVVGLVRGSPASPPLKVGPYEKLYEGVYCLYKPAGKQPRFDVVFIHGLRIGADNEQWLRTWTTRDGTQCWPQTWLPQRFSDVRVLALSYDSAATHWTGKNPHDLWENAIGLLNGLVDPAVGLGKRPYFLVGHSMGGLLAKELLLRADKRNDIPGLRDNCMGTVYYGVPHLGAGAAKLATLFNSAFFNVISPTVFLTDELKLLGESCYQRNLDFAPLQKRYPSQNFIETVETLGVMVVPKEIAGCDTGAANMAFIENANHSQVCKPSEMTDRSFAMFVTFMNQQAPGNLQ